MQMLNSFLAALGVDPDQFKEQIENFFQAVQQIDARLKRIEEALNIEEENSNVITINREQHEERESGS